MAQEAGKEPQSGVQGLQETADNKSTADILAELRQKVATYRRLEAEISKLQQEETTLENYVANLMASAH
ncbi:hypothetical protein GGI26_000751 [Coemansia sp. RSA 1358]|uniref:Uncharacterized protein n=1 Tax=Coemansia umbellata TaxID=1424467 RepID=A0ABQ8PSK1_9FUNG|nr:hypothetical protein EDC05_002103 [Coemansia umbellata]KAJ2625281.1 hypothetical protein GGI26_000751 [Coemansia sp. RSA 1358]